MSFIGSFISAKGSRDEGIAKSTAYKYNAAINEQNAVAARIKSDWEEEQSRERTRKLLGTQRALYAKAGVDLSSGSPLLVLAETASEGEEEAQYIKWGGDVAVAEQKNQATLNRFYAKASKKAGNTAMWADVAQGVGGAAQSYYGAKG
jgi:hypothetical protein